MSSEAKKSSMGFDIALSSADPTQQKDWEIRLGFLIHDAARMRRIVIDETFKPLGVTRSQAWVMAYLSRRDGRTQSDLAEDMGLGKVTLGGLIDRLQDVGMVERRADPSDRRVNRIHMTAAGRQVIKDMRKLTHGVNKELLKGLEPAEVQLCAQLLKKLTNNLERVKANFEK